MIHLYKLNFNKQLTILQDFLESHIFMITGRGK